MRVAQVGVVWCGQEDRQAHYERAVEGAGGTVRRILPGDDPEEVIAGIDGLLLGPAGSPPAPAL